jgi:hypothetical protein
MKRTRTWGRCDQVRRVKPEARSQKFLKKMTPRGPERSVGAGVGRRAIAKKMTRGAERASEGASD